MALNSWISRRCNISLTVSLVATVTVIACFGIAPSTGYSASRVVQPPAGYELLVNPYDEAVAYAGGYWQPTEAGDDDALDRALQLAAMASTGRQLFQQQQEQQQPIGWLIPTEQQQPSIIYEPAAFGAGKAVPAGKPYGYKSQQQKAAMLMNKQQQQKGTKLTKSGDEEQQRKKTLSQHVATVPDEELVVVGGGGGIQKKWSRFEPSIRFF